jgi:Cu-processing system permease protein
MARALPSSPTRDSLGRILAIARSTYKEIVRDRLLYAILVVAVLVTASSFFLATISLDQSSRVLQNTGLASIHLFSVLICVFVAANSIAKDADRRVLYLLFPKPVSRSQYVLGKYLGMVFLAITTLAILGILFSIGTFVTDRSLIHSAVVSLCYSFLEVSFLSAVSILFASFASSLNAALYAVALFVIGHSLGTVRDFLAATQGSQFLRAAVNVVYYLLPNLQKFDVRTLLLYGLHIPAADVVWTLLYWAIYSGLVLFLAVQVTKLREV